MNDNTKIGIFVIVILLLLYSGKLTEVVTAKVNGVPIPNLGTSDFNYSVCGIAPDVVRNGLAIKVCTDPITGNLYPIEDYPNNGDSAQIVYLKEQRLIDENLRLNTPTTVGVTTGPMQPSLWSKITDSLKSNQL